MHKNPGMLSHGLKAKRYHSSLAMCLCMVFHLVALLTSQKKILIIPQTIWFTQLLNGLLVHIVRQRLIAKHTQSQIHSKFLFNWPTYLDLKI